MEAKINPEPEEDNCPALLAIGATSFKCQLVRLRHHYNCVPFSDNVCDKKSHDVNSRNNKENFSSHMVIGSVDCYQDLYVEYEMQILSYQD